ncbi:MAG: hypothetical protein H0W74_12595 [Sphingosinicella sp.]|nr:hypothetical protein [Sphingosinicella sp.]
MIGTVDGSKIWNSSAAARIIAVCATPFVIVAISSANAQVHADHSPVQVSTIARAPVSINPYVSMFPLEAYLEKSELSEIALARSAAPASISGNAEVLVLDATGHHRALTGKNGWTCLVQRSWNDAYEKPDFWNPSIRVPICFNMAAARSILPVYLERTKWVLAKRSLADVLVEARAHPVPDPEPGSFAMMMSKQGYLADGIGPAYPHVMVYMSNVPEAAWGANLLASPVGATPGYKPSITVFYLPAKKWSDGTDP